MKIRHLLHVYADGAYGSPIDDHMETLTESGLSAELDCMYVGFVGSETNIEKARERMMAWDIPFVTLTRCLAGWEQESMRWIPRLIEDFHGALLYTHTKGSWAATQPSPPQREDHVTFNQSWRLSMTHDLVTNWAGAVKLLSTEMVDAVGSHRIMPPHGNGYYGGNFWMARTDYLRTLPRISEENRHQAEGWIAENPEGRLVEVRSGWPGLDVFWEGAL